MNDFNSKTLSVLGCLFLFLAATPTNRITIYMVGDSTMANKAVDDNPERGWGQLLPTFFDSTVRIENHARNGRSTRSFLREGLWQPVVDTLKPGDYVIIQFGHNDEKKDDRGTTLEEYRSNLLRFVSETRAKGARPILCTPIVRRRFNQEGEFHDDHGKYPQAVRDLARDKDVPLLDMDKESADLVSSLGPEESKKIYLWILPGEYKSLPKGREDNTHFSEYGATRMAAIAVDEIERQKLDLAQFLKH